MQASQGPASNVVPIDADTHRAIDMLIERMPDHFEVRDVILFGSRARRDHREDSDADVALVIRHLPNRFDAVFQLAGIAFDVMLETGVLVQALPIKTDEYDHPEQASNPELIRAILLEGVRL